MHLFLPKKVRDFWQESYYLNGNVTRPFIFLYLTLLFPWKTTFALQTRFCVRGYLKERENRVLEGKSCGLVRRFFDELLEQVTLLSGGRIDKGVEID